MSEPLGLTAEELSQLQAVAAEWPEGLRWYTPQDGPDAHDRSESIRIAIEAFPNLVAALTDARAATSPDSPRWLSRATQGPTVGEDEWGRSLYVIRDHPPVPADTDSIPFPASPDSLEALRAALQVKSEAYHATEMRWAGPHFGKAWSNCTAETCAYDRSLLAPIGAAGEPDSILEYVDGPRATCGECGAVLLGEGTLTHHDDYSHSFDPR